MAGLLSCAKTDRIYDDTKTEIAMKPVMHTPTKEIVEGTTYPAGVNFGVIAYYSSAYGDQDKWPADLTGENAPVPYINDQEFVTQGDGTFGGSDPCYWPHQGSLVFAGYSPYGSGTPSFECSTKTLTITGFESNGQTDLMYFLPEVSDDGNGNLNLIGRNNSSSPVPAAFSHALTLLTFNIYGIDGDEEIELESLTLEDLCRKGNLDVTAGGDPVWTRDDGSKSSTVIYSPATDKILTATTPKSTTYLAIPGSAPEVAISCIIHAYEDTEKDYIIETAEQPEWEAGKHYIYDITLTSGYIVVNLTENTTNVEADGDGDGDSDGIDI